MNMEKVYIVFAYDGERFNVDNVFSSRLEAEKQVENIKSWKASYMDDPYIEEYPVLPVKEG